MLTSVDKCGDCIRFENTQTSGSDNSERHSFFTDGQKKKTRTYDDDASILMSTPVAELRLAARSRFANWRKSYCGTRR